MDWQAYFEQNRANLMPIPWDDPYQLTPGEIHAILYSLQQFQLGESSEGNHLMLQARRYAAQTGDHTYLPVLQLFIQEEQRHAGDLGRFMEQQNLPLMQTHWVDTIFRHLRQFATLEMSIVVLLTAEIIAVAYYKALLDATQAPMLRQICRQILRDEIQHLRFQIETLIKIRGKRSHMGLVMTHFIERTLFGGTLCIVWWQHGRVFRAGGWSVVDFWQANWGRFQRTFIQGEEVYTAISTPL